MNIKVTILGCGSASPNTNHYPTAQYIETNGLKVLLDCGEGTQFQILKYKLSILKIDIILISHLHGDHFFGLPALLNTMLLNGRQKDLKIYAPRGLKKLIWPLIDLHGEHPFKIEFIETSSQKSILPVLKKGALEIVSIKLNHSIYTRGFIFKIHHTKPVKTTSYAFVSDTAPFDELTDLIKNTNILYHEATFLNNLLDRAQFTKHSTAAQAATVAMQANVNQLIVGHFSSRYKTNYDILKEATSIFENTIAANEGLEFLI